MTDTDNKQELATSKEITQSYLTTTAKYNFSVNEKRILYKIIEHTQYFLKGEKLNKKINIFEKLDENICKIQLPIADCFPTDNGNYVIVKDALKSLQSKTIEFEIKSRNGYYWAFGGLIFSPTFNEKGVMTFYMQNNVLETMYNFAGGYRQFNLDIAMGLSSVYSMRLYELIAGQDTSQQPKHYKIETLRDMFKLNGDGENQQPKYPLIGDFLKRVIKPAQKELKEKADWYFEYEPVKKGRKIVQLVFWIYRNEKNTNQETERKTIQSLTSIEWDVSPAIQNVLKNHFNIDRTSIKTNRDLFEKLHKKYPNDVDLLEILQQIFLQMRKTDKEIVNPAGYLIRILQSKVQ